jgi:integrase
MNEKKFEVVEKHLYRRQYQTSSGDWSTLYYGVFKCWDGKRRWFPLADNLKAAREALTLRLSDNLKRYDFDAEKREQQAAKIKPMTVSEWLDKYLELVAASPSYKTKVAQCRHLKRLLGSLPLADVSRVRILEYKNRRGSESLVRHGKPIEGTQIQGSTVNREVSCLITALNLAAGEGLCEGAPRIRKERETARERTLTDKEYQSLLDVAPRWLQRVLIGANEAALDQSVLLKLTWDSVRDGLISLKGGREKTGGKQSVGISPALAVVLDELRAEYRRVPNMDKRVFTRNGKPIPKSTLRHAFDRAVSDAKVEVFQFRDFRHCARTRWAAAGLPFEVSELGLGHKLRGMAGKYVNLTDGQVRDAFQKMFTQPNFVDRVLTQENKEAQS